MSTLTDQQIDFLEAEIKKHGISHPDLGPQLLDHFACGVEREMDNGLGFHEAYHKVFMEICPTGMHEIEQSYQQVITYLKYLPMKKFVFALGFVSATLFAVGYIFKNMHWPTANMQILIGSSLFAFLFLPLYFILKYNTEKEQGHAKPALNYLFNLILVMILALVVPYKQFNWPGNNEFFLVGQILLAFVFFPKVFLGWYRKYAA